MAAPTATLGGFTLTGDEPVGWELSQGVEPVQRTFTMEASAADKLFEAAGGLKPQTLIIKVDGSATLTVNNLYVLSVQPTRAPYLSRVLVADGRFLWSRVHVCSAYNIRRETGDRYLLADAGSLGPIPPQNDIFYAAYSLQGGAPNNGKPWDARNMIEDVLKQVTRVSNGYDLSGFNGSTELPVEGVTFDDAGPAALTRALAYCPGLAVYLDYSGMAQLTLKQGGREGAELGQAAPPVVDQDLVADVDLANVRPSAVEVYFTLEQEVRFDYVETAALPTSSGTDPRTMTNVMPLPDPALKFPDGTIKYQGTWVPIDNNLFSAFNSDPNSGGFTTNRPGLSVVLNGPNFSFDVVQKWFLVPGGGMPVFDEIVNGTNPVHQRRWQALMQHYRQTYQINRRWVDRVRNIEAVRAGIMDFTNGVRAPSVSYQNYTVIPIIRRLAKVNADSTKGVAIPNTAFITNASQYAYGSLPSLNGLYPMPTATVDVVDADQGIVRVHVYPQSWGDYHSIIPSNVQSIWGAEFDGNIPSTNPKDQANVTAGFMLNDLKLSTNHACSLVLTLVPASPNNLGQFYRVTVTPSEAKAVMPDEVSRKVGDCRGPVWQLRVGPGIMTARQVWIDAQATQIEQLVYNGPSSPTQQKPPGSGGAGGGSATGALDLLINKKMVTDFAKAAAANLYSALADHVEGTYLEGWDPSRFPVGRIDSVSHDLARNGVGLTGLKLPGDPRPIDTFSMLPESIRRQVLGLVQPRGGG